VTLLDGTGANGNGGTAGDEAESRAERRART
jgi:hypothetical protein